MKRRIAYTYKYLLLIIINLNYTFIFSQKIRHKDLNNNHACFNCRANNIGHDIFENYKLKDTPFNNVLQLSVKQINDIKHYSTTSFISSNCLITARHCVEYRDAVEFIELRTNKKNNEWIILNRSDFEIYYYSDTFKQFDHDLAIIKILNKTKLKSIYNYSFSVNNIHIPSDQTTIFLAGYPFNKFSINSTLPDTLVCRKTTFSQIEFNQSKMMMGYPMCTCPGDSGAPIWVELNDSFYILGIHQGSRSNEKGFSNSLLNVGVFFTPEVISWILSVTH